MKLTKTASGKIKLLKNDWMKIGFRAGWISKEAYGYHGAPSSDGEYQTEFFKDHITGKVNYKEITGEEIPIEVIISYDYTGGRAATHIDPKEESGVSITSIKDARTGEELEVDNWVEMEEFVGSTLLTNHEERALGEYEMAQEARGDQMREEGF